VVAGEPSKPNGDFTRRHDDLIQEWSRATCARRNRAHILRAPANHQAPTRDLYPIHELAERRKPVRLISCR
jgi:hypothetical protein